MSGQLNYPDLQIFLVAHETVVPISKTLLAWLIIAKRNELFFCLDTVYNFTLES